jgi:hypothetical protein
VRPGVAWPITLPTPPTITTRVTVSNAAEMAAAAAMSGVEVTFTGSGFVGTLNLGGRSDQRWIFPAGFTLRAPDGDYAIRAGNSRRIELIGTGGLVAGSFEAAGHSDMTIRGMDIRTRTNSTPEWLDHNQFNECNRVLIENSYLFAKSYAVWSAGCTNFVVNGSQAISQGAHATVRFQRADLVLWMNSRLVTQGLQYIFRAHENTNRFAGWGLQMEGSMGAYAAPAPTVMMAVRDYVMLDNSFYTASVFNTPYLYNGVVNVETGTVVGNRAFTNAEGSQLGLSPGPNWVVSNNSRLAATTPPAWHR